MSLISPSFGSGSVICGLSVWFLQIGRKIKAPWASAVCRLENTHWRTAETHCVGKFLWQLHHHNELIRRIGSTPLFQLVFLLGCDLNFSWRQFLFGDSEEYQSAKWFIQPTFRHTVGCFAKQNKNTRSIVRKSLIRDLLSWTSQLAASAYNPIRSASHVYSLNALDYTQDSPV